MVHPVFAVVLSLSLISPAASLAQSTNPPEGAPQMPHPGMHHEGPGPMGMHGYMGGVPAPVTNAPFSARFSSVDERKDREGKQMEHSAARSVYRDSLGRTREDVTLPPPPPRRGASDSASDSAAEGTFPTAPKPPAGPHTITVIFDPVANTITRLNPQRKIAIVQNVPADFFKHAEKREAHDEEGRGPRGKNATVTELGSKTFAGVVAQGKRVSHTFPSRDGQEPRTMTHEVWFSPDLKLEVSSVETMDRGTHSETLAALTKAEPDAALFKVPDGYTLKSGSDDSFHGVGHRGHGVPPPDAPPPAM